MNHPVETERTEFLLVKSMLDGSGTCYANGGWIVAGDGYKIERGLNGRYRVYKDDPQPMMETFYFNNIVSELEMRIFDS